MTGTYAGALAGSLESLSAGLLQRAPQLAADLLPPARPVVVIPPGAVPLPEWFCVAELRSAKGAHTTDSDYMSRLYVCWYPADTSQSPDAMVAALLPHLDWERDAEDFDFMP